MLSRVHLTLVLLAASAAAQADATLQALLDQALADARDRHHLPAVAALVQAKGEIAAEAALGFRALGRPEAVTVNDLWHVGSDTKAMTATMIARLVEQGVLRFDDTLAVSFPAFAREMNPAYRSITVRQLLSMTAGLPPLTEDAELPPFLSAIDGIEGVKAQRSAIARKYLAMQPASPIGEFKYSNLGFIIAGAIAEAHTGKTWEELLREQVFAPLGIVSAGFGAPGSSGKFDQPRGHRETEGILTPLDPAGPESDNPPALGPAGTVHIGLRDWMRFAQDQLDGVHGRGKLLKPESYRLLHTPVTEVYALGWGAKLDENGVPTILAHSGSNGFWLADLRILAANDAIILIVMNAGGDAADEAVTEIRKVIADRVKP